MLQREVQFFTSKQTFGFTTVEIALKPLVDSGHLREVAATNDEVDQLSKKFNPSFFEVLGDGELEALALLVADKIPDTRFSTADGPAIKALGALSMGHSGVSFESLLIEVGQAKNTARLPKHFKKSFFEWQLSVGRAESSILLSRSL